MAIPGPDAPIADQLAGARNELRRAQTRLSNATDQTHEPAQQMVTSLIRLVAELEDCLP